VALQILESGKADFDLVLTDIKMPRVDGVELGRRIVEGNWLVPILFLYMSGDPEAAGEGPAPLLRKPFSMSTLVEVVNRLLLGSAGGDWQSKAAQSTLQSSLLRRGSRAGQDIEPGTLRA
jgi:CheY-like chemotaxis protein